MIIENSDNNIKSISKRLLKAKCDGIPIDPISQVIGSEDISLAYAIQNTNNHQRLALGAKIIGKKIGLTSSAVQHQLGVDQPDFGILFNDMEISNKGILSSEFLILPKVEAEIAFVLKSDLTKKVITFENVVNAIDYAVAAIEVVDSRIKDWKISITDTIADNASASHFVLGDNKHEIDQLDLINCTMKLHVNNILMSEGIGKNCMGHPLNAVVWLANKMSEMHQPLKAGEVILSGALGKFVDIQKGDVVEINISGLGKANFSLN